MDDANQKLLVSGAGKLGIELDEGQVDLFGRYLEVLDKWAAKINLTAIKGERNRVIKLLVDSLAPAPTIAKMLATRGSLRVLDLGAGAGLPGVPIKIAVPRIGLVLCESRQKRAAFLKEIVRELGLSDTRVENSRAEEMDGDDMFDVVLARAVGSISELARLSYRLMNAGGLLVAMKGPDPGDEIDESRKKVEKLGLDIKETVQYELPAGDGSRTLVLIEKPE